MSRLHTLLLLALPASGKSEIRRYLQHVDRTARARDFHMGPTVQLDDYPYVQLMQLVDAEVRRAGHPPLFFSASDNLLVEPRDWGTLTRLLADDYAALGTGHAIPDHPTESLLERIDRARAGVGVPPVTDVIPDTLLHDIAAALDETVGDFLTELSAELRRYDDGATVIVEFARGGPVGGVFPLAAPQGYAYTLPHLGTEMLRRSAILYVWVTPEQSRRRNRERAGPGPHEEASILHHRVPDRVMLHDYGTDDLLWLIEQGDGAVEVSIGAVTHRIPAAVFDNRDDFTSFLRSEPATWPRRDVDAVHERLHRAFGRLAE